MTAPSEIVREMWERAESKDGYIVFGSLLNKWANWIELREAEIAEREKQCHHAPGCRCFAHINEALNAGDGTYKP